jgi:hypothetical protein
VTSVDGLKCLFLCFCFDCAHYTMELWRICCEWKETETTSRIIFHLWQKLLRSELNNKSAVVKYWMWLQYDKCEKKERRNKQSDCIIFL